MPRGIALVSLTCALIIQALLVGCKKEDSSAQAPAAPSPAPAAVVPAASTPAVQAALPEVKPAAPAAPAAASPLVPDPPLTAIDYVPQKLPTFEMVQIPAGSIEMPTRDGGTEIVQVKSFWLGKTEVTWEQYDIWHTLADLVEKDQLAWKAKYGNVPYAAWSRPSPAYGAYDRGYGHDGWPAIGIHFNAAAKYCQWLSSITGRKYRLPTEAEWEYAARAGGPELKFTDKAALDKIAWFEANTVNDIGEYTTMPVGKKEPNAFGLHDMLGNTGEWVMGYDGQYVLKGGSFLDKISKVNSRERVHYDEGPWQLRNPQDPKSVWWLSDGPFAGFRIVRDD